MDYTNENDEFITVAICLFLHEGFTNNEAVRKTLKVESRSQ
jgi:hypothetical protein